MKKLIILMLLLALMVMMGFWLAEHPGQIIITWLEYEVTTSVAAVIALAFVIVLFISILRIPVKFVRWVRRSVDKHKEKYKDQALIEILNAIAANDPNESKAQAKRLDRLYAPGSTANLLLKAMLTPSLDTYHRLADHEETELAGWRGMIAEYEKTGEIARAQELAEKAMSRYRSVPWVVDETLQLQVLNEEWKKAMETLNVARKLKLVDRKAYLTQQATILMELGDVYEAFKTAPWIPDAALCAAQARPRKAEKIFKKSWENQPSWEVYKAYIALFKKENNIALFKRTEKLTKTTPGDRLNAVVLADAALNARLWGEARKELTDYLAQYPLTVQVASMMATLETDEMQDTKEAQKWLEKIKSLEPAFAFRCTQCSHPDDEWRPTCPICNGFATYGSIG